jgi:uncharacterized protein with HEPN domain
MSRSLQLYLDDICTSCTKIQRYTLNMTLTDFVADERTYDAVVRNLQIIGEAVKQIPPNIRGQYPPIEWRKIVGLWDIVQNKVPELLEQVQHIDLGAQD